MALQRVKLLLTEQGRCGYAERLFRTWEKGTWSRLRRGLSNVRLEDGLEHPPLAVPPLRCHSGRHVVLPR
jgi:hypothetical protein